MKIIDYNPGNIVPPIHENYINTKMIISDLKVIGCHFVSYMKKENSEFYFYGSDIHIHRVYHQCHRWNDSYNKGSSMLNLLINEWEWLPNDWTLTHIIIESRKELFQLIHVYKIRSPFRESLINHWNTLNQNL